MIKICLFILITFILIIALIIFYPKQNNILSIKKLDYYISLCLKKRKIVGSNIKKQAQNGKINQDYKLLKKSNLTYLMKSSFKDKEKIYAEKVNSKRTEELKKISLIIDKKINLNSELFRSFNGECLIETIAKSLAHAVLTIENFNMFSCFSFIASKNKIYKKEAEILNVLASKNLIMIYVKLQDDINKINKLIHKGKRAKKITKDSPSYIYGAYMFNPLSTKLFVNKQKEIIGATTRLISELDEICYKQRIVYNYVKFLMK